MMFSPPRILAGILVCLLPLKTLGLCYNPSPAFPPPEYKASSQDLQDAFSKIAMSLKDIMSSKSLDMSSFSVEVTSSKETLGTFYHTAKDKNETRPGAVTVNGSSVYRIASITKVFTVLGVIQQHVAGKLHLDDTIDKYIPELTEKQNGSIRWRDITLRTLASQLSGIPNDCKATQEDD
jgi:CubicO group peptidase (beta-lactamase class C family)